MAYAYANWITYTGTDRLTALRNHIAEVSAEMSAAMSSGSSSYNPGPLQGYLDKLMERETALSNAIHSQPFFLPTRRRF